MNRCWWKGECRGVASPVMPDGPDVLDGGGGMEGLGVLDCRRVRRVRRVGWWFMAGVLNQCTPRQP